MGYEGVMLKPSSWSKMGLNLHVTAELLFSSKLANVERRRSYVVTSHARAAFPFPTGQTR